MKSLFKTLTLSSVLLLSAQAMAGDKGPRGPMMSPDAFPVQMLLRERVAEKLALTEAQKTQITALLDSAKANRPSRDDMKAKRAAFKALMDADSFDENQARALLAERGEAQLAHLKLTHQVMQVLSAEQKATLADIKHHRHHRRDE